MEAWTFIGGAALLVLVVAAGDGCAPIVKRDLSHIPAGQVGFDDLCDLQVYFDGLATKKLAPPALVSSSEVQNTATSGDARRMSGRSRYAFETDFQLQTIRRLLDENWQRLPDTLGNTPRIELDVWWSEKSGLRRVLSSEKATLIVAGRSSALPYHVCLSELLFGAPLYRQRREILGPPPPSTSPAVEQTGADSSRDAGSSGTDAGAGAG